MKITILLSSQKTIIAATIMSLFIADHSIGNEAETLNFKSVYDTDDISIMIADTDDKRIISSKFSALVQNTTIDTLKDHIFALEPLTHWFAEVSSATLIDKVSENKQRAKLITDMPFTLTDRETIMIQEVIESTPNRIRIKLTANYDGQISNGQFVRVDHYDGEWVLTQRGNHSLVELLATYNPKITSLPQSLVVRNLKSTAYSFVENVTTY